MSSEPPHDPGQVQRQVVHIENTGYSYRAHCACGSYATKHYRTEASACRAVQQHADDRNAARRASGSAQAPTSSAE